jgi:amino acid transporter
MSKRTSIPLFTGPVRFWLTLLVFGGILWLGGTVMRTMIANEFFIPGTLEYLPDVSLDQERTLFQLISAASTLLLIAYGVVLVSAIVLLRILPLRRRENGWLLMASILFFLFVPVEFFTGYLDLKFILLWNNTTDLLDQHGIQSYAQHSSLMRETLSHRIGALGGLPVIAMLSYLTAVAVVIWQPLRFRSTSEGDAS